MENFRRSYDSVTPQRRDFQLTRNVRHRKFPGPAGLLPEKDMMDQSVIPSPRVDSNILHSEEPLCSQSAVSVFEGAAWLQMLKDFELCNGSPPLSQFTVAWVKKRAAARQLQDQKVPFLATALRDLDCSSPDPCVVLHDQTGEIHGTLHREVWEQYGGQLSPGSILVLRNVGVLSTGVSARCQYLNVTCNNIISIYSDMDREVRATRVHLVTYGELERSARNWQARPSPAAGQVGSNSMFNVIGSPASPLSSRPNGWQQPTSRLVPLSSGKICDSSYTNVNFRTNNNTPTGKASISLKGVESESKTYRLSQVTSDSISSSKKACILPISSPHDSGSERLQLYSFSENKVPRFKGGFTPKVSQFGNSVTTSSSASSKEVHIGYDRGQEESKEGNVVTEAERSVLDVLEGLDTSSLFDDF
ncbi:uncharacterized protein [Periplaneta americana]|uniref:uncharacterized protein isoform X2 n=1 Tax=Periplaneta americana TaxID=6978 RepID=UPI0037E915E4